MTKNWYTPEKFFALIQEVQKSKLIVATPKDDTIIYKKKVKPKPKALTHLQWVKDSYPEPIICEHGEDTYCCAHCKPFPEIDYSWMVLRTKEERDAHKAAAKGIPIHMLKLGHGKNNKKRF